MKTTKHVILDNLQAFGIYIEIRYVRNVLSPFHKEPSLGTCMGRPESYRDAKAILCFHTHDTEVMRFHFFHNDIHPERVKTCDNWLGTMWGMNLYDHSRLGFSDKIEYDLDGMFPIQDFF